MKRRSFLFGSAAIIGAGVLMPIRAIIVPPTEAERLSALHKAAWAVKDVEPEYTRWVIGIPHFDGTHVHFETTDGKRMRAAPELFSAAWETFV